MNYTIRTFSDNGDDNDAGMVLHLLDTDTRLYMDYDTLDPNYEYDGNNSAITDSITKIIIHIRTYDWANIYDLCSYVFVFKTIESLQESINKLQQEENTQTKEVNLRTLNGNIAHFKKMKDDLDRYDLEEMKQILILFFEKLEEHIEEKE